ncbi:MAG: rhodanese-like domain-containing protein [Candidatus Paceibacterota bacterium]
MTNISPKEAHKKIGDFVVIDARTSEEYNGGHIEGALNVDVSIPSFAGEIVKLDKSKKYLVYCNMGNRSFFASNMMSNAGFNEIFLLEGGIFEWKRNNLPVEN